MHVHVHVHVQVHKGERWNINYNVEHCNSPGLIRTLKEMTELAGEKVERKVLLQTQATTSHRARSCYIR